MKVNLANYFKIRLTTDTAQTLPLGRMDSISINGLDVWLSNKGNKITE